MGGGAGSFFSKNANGRKVRPSSANIFDVRTMWEGGPKKGNFMRT